MSRAAIKTNNDHRLLKAKIDLRLQSLPGKSEINVLDCFGGEGVLWKMVAQKTDKKINVLSIDKVRYNRVQLQGDSIKFIKTLDLSKFDIIDLDSYGSPADHLELIFGKGYRGVVHVTYIIQNMTPSKSTILESAGVTKRMVKKCKAVFKSNHRKYFFNYLYTNGIKKATGVLD